MAVVTIKVNSRPAATRKLGKSMFRTNVRLSARDFEIKQSDYQIQKLTEIQACEVKVSGEDVREG